MTRKLIRYWCLVVVPIILFSACGQEQVSETHSMDDLEAAVTGLLASTAEDAFLIVLVTGTDDFVQMSAYQGSAELDFPQVSERQKALRPKVESVCEELGLTLRVTEGSDGTEFLDYDLPNDASEIAEILRRVLVDVFGVSDSSVLEFRANGFDASAA